MVLRWLQWSWFRPHWSHAVWCRFSRDVGFVFPDTKNLLSAFVIKFFSISLACWVASSSIAASSRICLGVQLFRIAFMRIFLFCMFLWSDHGSPHCNHTSLRFRGYVRGIGLVVYWSPLSNFPSGIWRNLCFSLVESIGLGFGSEFCSSCLLHCLLCREAILPIRRCLPGYKWSVHLSWVLGC